MGFVQPGRYDTASLPAFLTPDLVRPLCNMPCVALYGPYHEGAQASCAMQNILLVCSRIQGSSGSVVLGAGRL